MRKITGCDSHGPLFDVFINIPFLFSLFLFPNPSYKSILYIGLVLELLCISWFPTFQFTSPTRTVHTKHHPNPTLLHPHYITTYQQWT